MLPLIIISSDKQQRESYALDICKKEAIDTLDITIVQTDGTIGVEDIRQMQATLYLKPFKSPQKAIVLFNAQTATIEAQNSLLKVLEEPPMNTIVILTAETEGNFLPTIISRCKLVLLNQEKQSFSPAELIAARDELTQLRSGPFGYKLKKAQNLAEDKEKAHIWLIKMIYASRDTMLVTTTPEAVQEVYQLHQSYLTSKKTNINLRFLLEDTFLSL